MASSIMVLFNLTLKNYWHTQKKSLAIEIYFWAFREKLISSYVSTSLLFLEKIRVEKFLWRKSK